MTCRAGDGIEKLVPAASRFWPVGACVGVAGCAAVLGVDDYRDAPDQASTSPDGGTESAAAADGGVTRGASSGTIGRAPSAVYLQGMECETCVAHECAAESDVCAADRSCPAQMIDVKSRLGPVAAYERLLRLAEDRWAIDHGGEPRSAPVWALRGCIARTCASACRIGRDFSCAGEFDWTAPAATTVRTKFAEGSIGTSPPLAGWPFKLCPDADLTCQVEVGSGVTDASGMAEVTLANPSLRIGYWYAAGTVDIPPFVAAVSRPLATNDYLRWYPFPRSLVSSWYETFKLTFNDEASLIQVQPYDCQGDSAKHVTVDIRLIDPAPRPCPDCALAYENGVGVPDPLIQVLSDGDFAYIANVPAVRVVLVVREAETNEIVAIEPLSVRRGAVHFVRIHPYTRSDLELVSSLVASEG